MITREEAELIPAETIPLPDDLYAAYIASSQEILKIGKAKVECLHITP